MIIKYNNTEYNIPNYLNQIEGRDDLMSLPLEVWLEYFTKLTGQGDVVFMKKVLVYQIMKQDLKVNSFTFRGKDYWWDKNTRIGLDRLANSGKNSYEIVLGTEIVEISKSDLQDLLNQLEVYANKCFVNTHRHLNAIEALNTPLELIEYNYTLGYPDKIVIE